MASSPVSMTTGTPYSAAIAALIPASDIETPLRAMRVSKALEIVCARTPVVLEVEAW